MEDEPRDNSNVLVWILGGLVLVAAVTALIIAVSANDNSVNEDQVVKETKEQLKGELAGLGGAIAASKKASDVADRQAARDRRRIKRQVTVAVAGGEKQLDHLSAEAKELLSQMTALEKQNRKLKSEVTNLTTGQEELEAEVTRLNKRVRNLSG